MFKVFHCWLITGVSICYISNSTQEAKSTFLHLEKIENKTGAAIAQGFKNVLKIYNIKMQNVVAICKCL